jgi:hypothetical protein
MRRAGSPVGRRDTNSNFQPDRAGDADLLAQQSNEAATSIL